VVDLIRDGDSVSFMTNTGNSQMFRRRDILEDCVLNQSR